LHGVHFSKCGAQLAAIKVLLDLAKLDRTHDIVRAVQLIELDENLNRRELSPALRQSLTKRRKALYQEERPETKRGSGGGRAKARKGAKSQNATEQTPAFIDAHAKQTGRHRATIARPGSWTTLSSKCWAAPRQGLWPASARAAPHIIPATTGIRRG
jgi:hypothetical protein